MAENAWTQADETMLVVGFRDGGTPDDLAGALRKTPGSVRWKLNALGLVTLPCAPPGVPKPQYDEQELAHRRGDLAFKRAMLRAIRAGTERVQPVVIGRRVTRYVRHIIPVVESGYRSSAGYAADMGVDNGRTRILAERTQVEKRRNFNEGQIASESEGGRPCKTKLEDRMISVDAHNGSRSPPGVRSRIYRMSDDQPCRNRASLTETSPNSDASRGGDVTPP